MSVHIPQPFDAELSGSIGSVGPVTLSGIPSTFHIDIDNLPKIQLGVDPVTISVDKLPKIQLGLDPITINPLTLNLAITEFPSVRTHVPADYNLGFSLFGVDMFNIRLTGEAQVITEPYRPGPCEQCGSPSLGPAQPFPGQNSQT